MKSQDQKLMIIFFKKVMLMLLINIRTWIATKNLSLLLNWNPLQGKCQNDLWCHVLKVADRIWYIVEMSKSKGGLSSACCAICEPRAVRTVIFACVVERTNDWQNERSMISCLVYAQASYFVVGHILINYRYKARRWNQ